MRKLDFDKIKFSGKYLTTAEALHDVEPLVKPTIWEIGRRIRLMADEQGKTVQDIANHIECDVDKVDDVLAGRRIMHWSQLEKVCEFLSVTPEEIVVEDMQVQLDKE